MIFTKVCLYGFLFVLFLVFFGVPSLKKYQRQETIFISTRKLTKGIEAPAVTIMAFNNNTGYGWKSETYFHLLVGWIQRLPWTFRRYFRWTWGPCNVAEVNTKMFWLFSVFKVLCFTGTMKYLGMGCWTRRIRTPGSVKIGLTHLPLLAHWWIQRQKGCKFTFFDIFQWI